MTNRASGSVELPSDLFGKAEALNADGRYGNWDWLKVFAVQAENDALDAGKVTVTRSGTYTGSRIGAAISRGESTIDPDPRF